MDTFTDKSWEFKRESLLQRIDIHSRKVEALKYHDLFKQLAGNPSSIVILAAYYSSKFHEKQMTLRELYKSVIKDGKESNEYRDDISSEFKATICKNNISLNLTTEASIRLLQDSAIEHLNMLYYLGCLPGGVMMDQLKEMREDVETSLEILDGMAFLEHDEPQEYGYEKKVLTTHLIAHV